LVDPLDEVLVLSAMGEQAGIVGLFEQAFLGSKVKLTKAL